MRGVLVALGLVVVVAGAAHLPGMSPNDQEWEESLPERLALAQEAAAMMAEAPSFKNRETALTTVGTFLYQMGYGKLAEEMKRGEWGEFPYQRLFESLWPVDIEEFIVLHLIDDTSLVDMTVDTTLPLASSVFVAMQHLSDVALELNQWVLPPGVPVPEANLPGEGQGDVALAMQLLKEASDGGNTQASVVLAGLGLWGERRLLNDEDLEVAGVDTGPKCMSLLSDAASAPNKHGTYAKDLLAVMYLARLRGAEAAFNNDASAVSVLRASREEMDRLVALTASGFLSHRGVRSRKKSCARALPLYSAVANHAVTEVSMLGYADPPIRLWEAWEDTSVAQLRGDKAHHLDYHRELAAGGDVEAMVALGEMHMNGDPAAGVPRNPAMAQELFQQAAAAGDPYGHYFLGVMAQQGMNGPPEPAQALRHFEAAAGVPDALNNIGYMHMSGDGVPRNITKATEFLEAAADEGSVDAHVKLGVLYLDSGNETAAREHFKLASDAGVLTASFNLALSDAQGWGGPQNCTAAVTMFKYVAEQGVWLARLPFASAHAYNNYEAGFYDAALHAYSMLAFLGDGVAQDNAAFLIEQGHGEGMFWARGGEVGGARAEVAVDAGGVQLQATQSDPAPPAIVNASLPHVTLELYTLAEDQPHALRRVGDCHQEGWGGVCAVNVSAAVEWYRKAPMDGGALYALSDVYAKGAPGIPANASHAWDLLRQVALVDYLSGGAVALKRLEILVEWATSRPQELLAAVEPLAGFAFRCAFQGDKGVDWVTEPPSEVEVALGRTPPPPPPPPVEGGDTPFAIDENPQPYVVSFMDDSEADSVNRFVRVGPARLEPFHCDMMTVTVWTFMLTGLVFGSLCLAACTCVAAKHRRRQPAPPVVAEGEGDGPQ